MLQLLLMHDLPNGCVRFMHSMYTLVCAGCGCAYNHMQDLFLKPQCADSSASSTVMSGDHQKPVSHLLIARCKCDMLPPCHLCLLDSVQEHINHFVPCVHSHCFVDVTNSILETDSQQGQGGTYQAKKQFCME
jgi:hypothetical protein